MRKLVFFAIVGLTSACGQSETEQSAKHATINYSNSSSEKVPDKSSENWNKKQDSLRAEILKRKDSKVLKGSFLEELYVRDAIRVVKGSLVANLNFNLHAPDCGAPDCYSTDVSFNFPLGDSLVFPEKLTVKEHEHGCVEKERKLTMEFQYAGISDKTVVYNCPKYKRSLVLFRSNDEVGTTAYYFTNVDTETKDTKNAKHPFASWDLSTNEYEHFLPKNK